MNESQRAEPRSVHRLEFDVDWPPGHAAAYVVDGREPILVDAGMTGEDGTDELIAGLDEYDLEPSDIEHVLLTHSHTDHVGQLQAVLEAGDAAVYAPRRVIERFDRSLEEVEAATRRNLTEAGVEAVYREPVVEHLVDAHERNRAALSTEMVDHWIEDGERVSIAGLSFEAIYTPGHHCTHLCYGATIGDEQVLFSGDMAIEPFRAAAIQVNFDDGVDEGVAAFFEALDRLADHSFDRVYPGHGPVHDRFADAIEESASDLQNRVDRCAEAVEASDGITAAEVAERQAEDMEERARILPEVVGALSYLEDEGAVESSLDGAVRYYVGS
jgi:glyoxylase-like metal-dependent hydrolase (beta-lactamase superfamily II)